MAEQQAVVVREHEEAVWAVVQPKSLNEANTAEMQRQVTAAAATKPTLPVVLDVTVVEFVPSVALGALVGLMRAFRNEGRRFLLVGVQPDIRTVLAITRLDKLFDIHRDFNEAVAHVRGGGL